MCMQIKYIFLYLIFIVLTGCISYNNDDLYEADKIQRIYVELMENPVVIDYPDSYWLNKQYTLSQIQKAKQLYNVSQ